MPLGNSYAKCYSYAKLSKSLVFSKLERMQNDVNQIFRQQQRKKEFISIFTSQHPLRAAYTFLPVPASAIASVIKHNSQFTCITTFCLNQLTSNKKNPKLSRPSPLLCYSKEWRTFLHQLTPVFQYFRPTCTTLPVFHNRRRT